MKTAEKTLELESLRGIAALLIVFHHLPGWFPEIHSLRLLRNGHLMVELFFVLSGYVIARTYALEIRRPGELLRFQFLRFGRLYPVHLLFLLVFLAIEAAKSVAATRFGIAPVNSVPFEGNSWRAFAQQLFLIQGMTENKDTFNRPAWTISVEFYTYLVFGVLALLGKANPRRVALLFFAVAAVCYALQAVGIRGTLLACFTGFFTGATVASLPGSRAMRLPSFVPLVPMAMLAGWVGLAPTAGGGDETTFLLSAFLIIAITHSRDGPARKLLRHRILVWLGTVSYSVYMGHAAVVWVVNNSLRLLLKRPEIRVNGDLTPQLGAFEYLLACAACVGLVLLVAWASYTLVEKPLRQRSREIAFGRTWAGRRAVRASTAAPADDGDGAAEGQPRTRGDQAFVDAHQQLEGGIERSRKL